jgi:hypothetical protein
MRGSELRFTPDREQPTLLVGEDQLAGAAEYFVGERVIV